MSTSLPQVLVNKAEKALLHIMQSEPLVAKGTWQNQQLLQALALSDFVAESCIQNPEYLAFLQKVILTNRAEDYQTELAEQLAQVKDETELQQKIRQLRRKYMLAITVRDLLNLQTIEDSLKQTSELANQLIYQTYQWLYQSASERHGTPEIKGQPMPLLTLGMGKLGGEELNFSSDIDLIFVYPAQGTIKGARKDLEHQQFFTRLAQRLIQALNKITMDGQVFRVDMRLRPFGDSGPLVMPFSAFENYYQEQGREWERYAMVKARIIGPRTPFHTELEQILTPFVYRRYADFGAIESLRQMKQLINQEVRRRQLKQNIKLGAGGIREIEFIVQSFQLIRGGRAPELQTQSLQSSLRSLTKLKLIPKKEANELEQAYLYLRKVEQCLQQFNDQQTQTLPDDEISQTRLFWVMQTTSYAELLDELSQHQAVVIGLFSSLIGTEDAELEQGKSNKGQDFQDIWMLQLTEKDDSGLLSQWLDKSQVSDYLSLVTQIRQDSLKRVGERGENVLNQLMPILLQAALSHKECDPKTILQRLGQVINAIAGRTTYLELLNENQKARNQLVQLCAASPWITEQVAHYPILLDDLISPQPLSIAPSKQQYIDELRQRLLRIDPLDLELQMEILREFKLAHQLQIAAADITETLPLMQVSDQLTFLAEAIIKEVVMLAWHQMAEKYGEPKDTNIDDNGFAVVGYGKLGGIELGYGSDLDLVFLHNCSSEQMTSGHKPIEARKFYIKLAQRIMHLFSTKTRSGQLYEVDLRLRPAGGAGLLVNHIKGFEQYQHQDAWTWEHQALVRARLIDGPPSLSAEFSNIRLSILSLVRENSQLIQDVKQMREKMRQHLSVGNEDEFDLKQDSGGIADIEFLVQYWVLAHTHSHANLAKWSDNVRILEMLLNAEIISRHTAEVLQNTYLSYRHTGHRLILQQQKAVDAATKFTQERLQINKIWQQALKSSL